MYYGIVQFIMLLCRKMYIDELRWNVQVDTLFQDVKVSCIHLPADKNVTCKTLLTSSNFVLIRKQ